MSNRDVIRRILISAVLFIFFDIHTAFSRAGKTARDSSRYAHNGNSSNHTYEHYLRRKDMSSNLQSSAKKSSTFYTVKRGDTLTEIGKKFAIPVDLICSQNKIKKQSTLKIGTKLKIPVKKKPSSKTAVNDPGAVQDSHKPPKFKCSWPLKHVIDCHNDGVNGVRSIGIIIIGKPGSNVTSSATGVVKKIGSMRGFGKYIVINHDNRYATVYANLGEISVSEGDTIVAGNTIGKMHITDRKLHFQIDFEGKPQDPLKYLPKNNNFFY